MSTELAVRFLETIVRHRDEQGQSQLFDTTALAELRDVRAEPGRVTARLPVSPAVSNRYSTLHGGCIATLIDTVGSAALITRSPKGGVSLNINVNYLSKVATGGVVAVEAEVVKVGRTIATVEVRLRDEASGALVATGTHVKFIAEGEATMDEILEQQRRAAQVAAASTRSRL